MVTIKIVREAAKNAGRTLIYNRSTGQYQIKHGFTATRGETPLRDESGKLTLTEKQLTNLLIYIC